MSESNISLSDTRRLLKIISDQSQWRSLLGHLIIDTVPYRHSKRCINLAPFLESPTEYLGQLSPKCLLAKCLSDIEKIRHLYLLTEGAQTTVDGFIEAMKFNPHGGNNRFSHPFSPYSIALCNLTDIRRPLRGRLEGLKYYSSARQELARFALLSRLGKKLEVARKFTKKPKAERDDYIRRLIHENPNMAYKALWCDADKEIIGDMKLRRFENICLDLVSASKRKPTKKSRIDP